MICRLIAYWWRRTHPILRRRLIADRYKVLIDALYSDAANVDIESEVRFEDGRTGTMKATLKIREAKTFTPDELRKAGLIHEDCMTATGKTMGEELDLIEREADDAVARLQDLRLEPVLVVEVEPLLCPPVSTDDDDGTRAA